MRAYILISYFFFGFSSLAHGASLGLNFVGADATRGTLGSSAVAGIPGYEQDQWRNITVVSTFDANFADTAGQLFHVTKPGGVDAVAGSLGLNTTDNVGDNNDMLMDGYVTANVATGDKLDVLSIPASYLTTGYRVIVYADGSGNHTQSIALDAGRVGDFTSRRFVMQDTATFNGSFVQAVSSDLLAPTVGANYVIFDNLTDASFSLLFSPQGASARRFFNAVQIVQIPEPATHFLLLSGFAGLMICRHRWRENRKRTSFPSR